MTSHVLADGPWSRLAGEVKLTLERSRWPKRELHMFETTFAPATINHLHHIGLPVRTRWTFLHLLRHPQM